MWSENEGIKTSCFKYREFELHIWICPCKVQKCYELKFHIQFVRVSFGLRANTRVER